MVTGRHVSGGLSVAGITLRSPAYDVHVSLVASRDCVWVDTNEEQLHATGECADVPVVGPIVGKGRTPEGNDLFLVRVDVSERCYEAITVGDRWPTALPECD